MINSKQLVFNCSNEDLHNAFKEKDHKIDLICTDPPYGGIVPDQWDNQWKTDKDFAKYLGEQLFLWNDLLSENASILIFGALGNRQFRPLFELWICLEEKGWFFRNWITWKKNRAYGKSHDYLYCREEILWLSKSPERTEINFNIPVTEEIRGYANNKTKSKYKRVSNVWVDSYPTIIEENEVFVPERTAQKPVKLLKRLIETHSNAEDLVIDPFCGTGTTGIACKELNRNFVGCDLDEKAIEIAKKSLTR